MLYYISKMTLLSKFRKDGMQANQTGLQFKLLNTLRAIDMYRALARGKVIGVEFLAIN
jgi:hypothetical protein